MHVLGKMELKTSLKCFTPLEALVIYLMSYNSVYNTAGLVLALSSLVLHKYVVIMVLEHCFSKYRHCTGVTRVISNLCFMLMLLSKRQKQVSWCIGAQVY